MKLFDSAEWQDISSNIAVKKISSFSALIFSMSDPEEAKAFEKFILEKPLIQHYSDILPSEIREWIKISHPYKKFTEADLDQAWDEWQAAQGPLEAYGTYIYYPWSATLIHSCTREQFIALRTSRNQYKITPEEQERLATKRVGVIGLSVGQSVAVTMAMERVFGKLRIADFDHLELTNLNRIRKGLDYIGLPKVIMVAREIAEIDPYLEVEIFPEGITDDNLSDFIGYGEGQLDLLVEECDSLDIKLKARLAARAAGIPVIMDTSDRGLVDIERFDLEPERPILHGMVSESEAQSAASLSAKERMSLVMKMVGLEGISTRLKASLLEVEQSLSTWPQLASSVVYGGAVATIIARHILLGRAVRSGRHYFDPESQLGLESESEAFVMPAKPAALHWDDLKAQVALEPASSEPQPVAQEIIEDIVAHACYAPSGGNVQPWKWLYDTGKGLFLFHDQHYSYSFLDFKQRGSLIGLGAALENLRQRAAFWSLDALIESRVEDYHSQLIAKLSFQPLAAPAPHLRFGESLRQRLTNRKKGQLAGPVPPTLISEAQTLLRAGYHCQWLQEPAQIAEMAQIIGEVERLRVLDPWGHADFIAEARWTEQEAEATRDGVDLRTMDLSEADKMGFQLIKDARALQHLRQWNRGQALVKMASDSVESSSALVLLYTTEHSAQAVLQGGMEMERLWLFLNESNWAYQPVSPATFMFARLRENTGQGDAFLIENLRRLRVRFLELWQLPESVNDLFVFRVFKADAPAVKSLRRPLEEVFNLNDSQPC